MCVALLASGLGFPRGVVALNDTQVLVADMGNWERGRGRLLLLDLFQDGTPARVTPLILRLDRPNSCDLSVLLLTRISEITARSLWYMR